MSDPTKAGQRTQYTQVTGIRAIRRLPRLGKIRLGIKVKNAAGVEYPKDVSWFVCPPEVQAVYGERPQELDVIIPVEDPKMFFPFTLKFYAASSLVCKGDGMTAERAIGRVDDADTVLIQPKKGDRRCKVKCPCGHLKTDENPKGECSLKATLMVMIPKVSMGGIYALDSGSIHNVIEINSCVAVERLPDPTIEGDEGDPPGFLRSLFGHVALIPLKLRRVERDIEKPDGKRVKKWLLQLTTDMNLPAVQQYRDGAVLALGRSNQLALPAPDRDITDDRAPIEVTDAEDIGSGPAVGGPSPPPPPDASPAVEAEKPPATGAVDSSPTVSGEAQPAQEFGAPSPGSPGSPERAEEQRARNERAASAAAGIAERQPGEDREEQSEVVAIETAINNAQTMMELDAVWRDRVLRNKELDGAVKYSLQDLLLERKKYLKKFGKK